MPAKHDVNFKFLYVSASYAVILLATCLLDKKIDYPSIYIKLVKVSQIPALIVNHLNSDADYTVEVRDQGDEYALFEVGYKMYERGDFHGAYLAFTEAWKVFNSTEHHTMTEVQIMDWLQYMAWRLGNVDEALSITHQILTRFNSTLSDDRKHEFEVKYRVYHQEAVFKFLRTSAAKLDDLPVGDQIQSARDLANTIQYDYCRDEYANERSQETASDPRFFCRYDNRGRHPFLMYSPVKEEIVSLNPVAVIIYDLVTPKEIDHLVNLAKNKLGQAAVLSKTKHNGQDINLHERRARNAWIESTDAGQLTRHLEVVTGMNTNDGDGCEMYQIGHYGIGGHYSPHYDYLGEEAAGDAGDRIATLLLYLNEVDEGGQTVFDMLKVRVLASKGAGLLWYNYHQNETKDTRTRHGGCPVIKGEKWVANKWFRFRGQLLHKPCGKYNSSDFTLADFDLPGWMKWSDPRLRQVSPVRRL